MEQSRFDSSVTRDQQSSTRSLQRARWSNWWQFCSTCMSDVSKAGRNGSSGITYQTGYGSMPTALEKAQEYLDALEADWQAAFALSQQKAEEAKLIKAQQEGFRAAMKMLGEDISVAAAEHNANEPARSRGRRRIPELIERELSFSGQAMTTRQIAKAVDYNPERTEIALRRMLEAGQVHRSGNDRWEIASTIVAPLAVRSVTGTNGKYRPPPLGSEQPQASY